MLKVLVTGGAGYVGCVLVPKLLAAGHAVLVYDLMLFGPAKLPDHPNLKVIQADIRDLDTFTSALKGVDIVIHMACISNDPSFELDPNLSKSINYDSFAEILKAVKKARPQRFIYASSSSVYGVKDGLNTTESASCDPLTDYSKYKLMCEEDLKSADLGSTA